MKKKVLSFIKSIFAEEYVVLSNEQKNSYIEHFHLDVFRQNPLFQNFAKKVQEIKASGQFKTHLGKEEVVAKTGEVKLTNGLKRHITTFVFDGTPQNLYTEVREESRISGIGSVWNIEDEGKLVFLFEGKETYGFDFNVVTIIDNPNSHFWQANIFDESGKHLGQFLGQKIQEEDQAFYRYDAIINSLLLGIKEEKLLKVSEIKTKTQIDYPLLALKKLYQKHSQMFLNVENYKNQEKDLEK